jgi:hypothetical protein
MMILEQKRRGNGSALRAWQGNERAEAFLLIA